MNIPFRTRRALKRLVVFLLILSIVAVIGVGCWFLWLDRYVIYTRDGVMLDFNQSLTNVPGQAATPPEPPRDVTVHYGDVEDVYIPTGELVQLSGYYIDTQMLLDDMSGILEQMRKLPAGTPLLVDVKNSSGGFFYTTNVGLAQSSSIDVASMDDLITAAKRQGLYLIARLPALRDRQFGLQNVECGLFLPSGIGLWMDDDGAYWLNPASTGTQTYLIQIATELRTLGFNEVVFADFRFPNNDKYAYSGNKTQAITDAAAHLVASCATDSFTVSFVGTGADFPLPQGRCRLYLQNATGSEAAGLAMATGLEDPAIRLVFLTTVNDTRFNDYSVLRPLTSALGEEE